jgi:hypothetical protein
VLDRELTYSVSFDRLLRLCKTATLKTYPACIWCKLIPVFSIAAMFGLAMLPGTGLLDALDISEGAKGFLVISGVVLVLLLMFVAFRMVRARNNRQTQRLVDFSDRTHLRITADGLSFRSEQIDYLLRWRGISQVFLEHDGVVISHGSLYFLIPDTAFSNRVERDAFISDVYSRIGEEARVRSEKYIKPALDASTSTAGT